MMFLKEGFAHFRALLLKLYVRYCLKTVSLAICTGAGTSAFRHIFFYEGLEFV